MRCSVCRSDRVTAVVEDRPYPYSPRAEVKIVLSDCEVRACMECGERSLTIPRIAVLHIMIDMALMWSDPGDYAGVPLRFAYNGSTWTWIRP